VPRASIPAFASSTKLLSVLVSATCTINFDGISVHQIFKSHVHQSSGCVRACAGELPEYIQFHCQNHLARAKRASKTNGGGNLRPLWNRLLRSSSILAVFAASPRIFSRARSAFTCA